jgi:hypothetical protein
MENRRPNKIVITTVNENDENVTLLKDHYFLMQVPTQINVVEKTEDGGIDVKLYLDEELLDNIGFPHKG